MPDVSPSRGKEEKKKKKPNVSEIKAGDKEDSGGSDDDDEGGSGPGSDVEGPDVGAGDPAEQQRRLRGAASVFGRLWSKEAKQHRLISRVCVAADAGARDRIGKGFVLEIKPLDGLLAKLQRRSKAVVEK